MKILFVIKGNIDPQSGGVSRVCSTLSDYWTKRNNEVFMLSDEYSRINFGYSEQYVFLARLTNLRENQSYLRELVDTEKIDFLILGYPDISSLIEIVSTVKGRVPIIGHYHNSPKGLTTLVSKFQNTKIASNRYYQFVAYHIQRLRYYKTNKRMGQVVDSMVVLCNKYRNELNKISGIPAEKVIAIPNPFIFDNKNEDIVSYDKRKKQILYVGRIYNAQKNIKLLLDVWQKLSVEKIDWNLCVVGDGNERMYWERYVKNKKISRCLFVGYQDPASFYKESRLFIMTSFFEGFPMVVVEAMKNGCVPVTCNTYAAATDIVKNSYNGFVVKDLTVRGYVNKLRDIMDNEDLLAEYSTRALADAQRYNVDIVAKEWCHLFENLQN